MVGVGGRGGGGSGGGGGGGGGGLLENANPLIYERSVERPVTAGEEDEQVADSIDAREIFDIRHCWAGKNVKSFFLHLILHLIRSINDPEHPLTLEELNVVEQVRVQVSDPDSTVAVAFTPTIPHCSMATLIGLSIKVKLLRSLPQRFKMDVHITPGTHASEHAVNKQLADKERVAAALENTHLLEVVNQCLSARS
ncbi:Mitotic spindle-associated MMXD complex subunit MIP18 [Fukomys damarensis]|uniref:Cytosolic iron-sulfur assembly component 2B n=1 Tax=Fukomys damarensis TaxID=885580 RepID=A0A091CMA2_FUKDA|nr:Mitotic spindle-associated MMXD complex subunit MIP18 [Fukomys damarensis]